MLQLLGASAGMSSIGSSVVSVTGTLSIIIVGTLADRFPSKRLVMLPVFVALLCVALALLSLTPGLSVPVATALLLLVGFGLMGPYSLVTSTYTVDLGGKAGAGLVSGLSDTCGYLGAMFAMGTSGEMPLPVFFRLQLALAVAALAASVALWRVWHVGGKPSTTMTGS